MKKILLSLLISGTFSAQSTVLFQQFQDTQGSIVPTTSTTAVKMYSADDFTVNANSKINIITLEGAQLQGNLTSILNNIDLVILEAPDLTGTPFNGNIVYQTMGTMTGVSITGSGITKNFVLDLSAQNVQVESGKKMLGGFHCKL